MTLITKSNLHNSHVIDFYCNFIKTFKVEIPRLGISFNLRDILNILECVYLANAWRKRKEDYTKKKYDGDAITKTNLPM